jgi:hypothetical protein
MVSKRQVLIVSVVTFGQSVKHGLVDFPLVEMRESPPKTMDEKCFGKRG